MTQQVHSITIGCPHLCGQNGRTLVAQNFAKLKFPAELRITNHMPRSVIFPEVDGLFLQHCAAPDGFTVQVSIASEEQFMRLIASIEQIASLNGYERALTIETTAESAPAPRSTGKAAGGKEQRQEG